MAKRWRIHPHDPARIASLARLTGTPAVVAQLLSSRGIHDPRQVRDFLEAKLTTLRDPAELPGAQAAAERLLAAAREGRRIVVYGDYDVDGMSGTAILLLALRLLGGQVSYYVPHRLEEGYGLSSQALSTLRDRGAQTIVTVDCGAASLDEADHAARLGLELIVTDHHALADRLPAADVVVHPQLPGTAYPFSGLCGAGVAFKTAWLLCQLASESKKVGERMRNFLLQAIGLAALGTIADVVPLLDENRVLVRHGLLSLRERPTPGIAALLAVTELDKKPELTAEDVAFSLAPRLNAAGRLGQATLAVELLATDSSARARPLAEYLCELNSSRESLERSVYLAANKQAQEQFDPHCDAALVLAGQGWHAGVIGIVASRLAEKFHRPAVVLSIDPLGVKPAVGSARSVPGFQLHQALAACGEHLVSHGGHAAAAGLKIEESSIGAFRAAFCEFAAGEIGDGERTAELWIDAEVPFSSLNLSAIEQMEQLAPFGHSNPRPTLCATGVVLGEPPRRIGGGERHLSLQLVQHGVRMRGVAFGGGEWADELARLQGPIAVAFRPSINHYRGRKTVDLHVCDWKTLDSLEQGTAAESPDAKTAEKNGSCR